MLKLWAMKFANISENKVLTNNSEFKVSVLKIALWSVVLCLPGSLSIGVHESVYEPRHEKTCHMRTTKVQISLRIHAVWSAPLLFAT